MSKRKAQKTELGHPLSLRVPDSLMEEIEATRNLYDVLLGPPGLNRAQVVRWAIIEGLPAVRDRIARKKPETKK